jgi:hypothetical protein
MIIWYHQYLSMSHVSPFKRHTERRHVYARVRFLACYAGLEWPDDICFSRNTARVDVVWCWVGPMPEQPRWHSLCSLLRRVRIHHFHPCHSFTTKLGKTPIRVSSLAFDIYGCKLRTSAYCKFSFLSLYIWMIFGPIHRVHRVATAAFWRTFSDEGKISPGWWGWGVHAHPFSLHLPSPVKLQCTLQLSRQTH